MAVRILHLHSTFSLGGKEARAVRLMNAFGDAAKHSIVSAMPGQMTARDAIAPGIHVDFPEDAPPLAGKPSLRRLRALSGAMQQFDLVLTYNWGAFDAVMARRLFGGPPLVHHEDGFNEDEAAGLKTSRNLYRRVGLPAAYRLIVPSKRLERVAGTAWAQPQKRVERISNGIRVERYALPPKPDAIPGLARKEGELVIGTVAGLRAVKNIPRLVRAFAAMKSGKARLVVVGEGPERERIAAEASRLGVADRVHLPGFIPEPERYMGAFDIFALSSDSEQFPISLVEAMAAGLPAVTSDVGDIASMLAAENRAYVVKSPDEAGFASALDELAHRPELRRAIGCANGAKASAEYDEKAMIERYARLYGQAVGNPSAFMPGKA